MMENYFDQRKIVESDFDQLTFLNLIVIIIILKIIFLLCNYLAILIR
jgi:hypothetical protein